MQLGRRRLDDHHIAAGRIRLVERGNLAAGWQKGGQRRSCLLRGEVAKVEGLDHERLEPWTIGRIVCINEDRPVIDLLEGVLVDLQDDVERLGHRHFIQLDRYRRILDRFIEDDVEVELAAKIGDDALELGLFETDRLGGFARPFTARKLDLIAGWKDVANLVGNTCITAGRLILLSVEHTLHLQLGKLIALVIAEGLAIGGVGTGIVTLLGKCVSTSDKHQRCLL